MQLLKSGNLTLILCCSLIHVYIQFLSMVPMSFTTGFPLLVGI